MRSWELSAECFPSPSQKLLLFSGPGSAPCPNGRYYLQPAAAGLLIGIVGLKIPQSMGTGYPYIDQALHSQYTWEILAVLGFAKILTTSLSFVSGTPGGMFAPTLFIGAMIGGAIGGLEHHFFPQVSASVGPFALVGMGTFFAGFLRVPITSVFMVVETTGSYSIVLPVMISNTIAYLISRKLSGRFAVRHSRQAGRTGIALDGGTTRADRPPRGGCDAATGISRRCRPAIRSLAPWKLRKSPRKNSLLVRFPDRPVGEHCT